jgi:hypothetical protein
MLLGHNLLLFVHIAAAQPIAVFWAAKLFVVIYLILRLPEDSHAAVSTACFMSRLNLPFPIFHVVMLLLVCQFVA